MLTVHSVPQFDLTLSYLMHCTYYLCEGANVISSVCLFVCLFVYLPVHCQDCTKVLQ